MKEQSGHNVAMVLPVLVVETIRCAVEAYAPLCRRHVRSECSPEETPGSKVNGRYLRSSNVSIGSTTADRFL
jgi:hypothetical protein